MNKYSTASIKTRWKLSWGKTAFKLLGINFHIELDQMEKINFKEKIQKIRLLIKLWNRRYLTPLGKITVIKTLLLPILNHLFISIPNPSEHIIKELNNIFIPPANFVCRGYTVFTLSVRPCVRPSVRPSVHPSVTLCFLNILKSHCWIFIKPCKHVHICKTNLLDKKVRARGQFYQSYFPL